jgi:DNA-binding transcriptional MerR regulator
MPSTEMFSSSRTCEIVGITYRQLDYWARTGLFVPTEQASGSGSRRQYSFSDLIHLRVVKKMLDSGMKLQEVKRATDYLSRQGESLTNADLIMTQDQVFLHDTSHPETLIDLAKTGQGVFTVVALSQAIEEVSSEIISTSTNTDEANQYIA